MFRSSQPQPRAAQCEILSFYHCFIPGGPGLVDLRPRDSQLLSLFCASRPKPAGARREILGFYRIIRTGESKDVIARGQFGDIISTSFHQQCDICPGTSNLQPATSNLQAATFNQQLATFNRQQAFRLPPDIT
jgi:hypothetical protein